MKRSLTFLFLLTTCAGILFAQNTWEGTAIVGGYGQFPREGLYAASNSFERNSVVEVTNPETGQSVEVIVVDRVSQPGVFMVLSEDAADELELDEDVPAQVSVRPATTGGLAAVPRGPEAPFSRDPEVNPSAGLTDPNREVLRRRGETAPEPAAEEPVEEPAEAPAEERAGVAETEQTPENVGEAAEPVAEPEPEPAPRIAEAPDESLPMTVTPPSEEPGNGIPTPEVQDAIRPEDEGAEAVAAPADEPDDTPPGEQPQAAASGLQAGIREASEGLRQSEGARADDEADVDALVAPAPAEETEPAPSVATPTPPEEAAPAEEAPISEEAPIDEEPEQSVLAQTLQSLSDRFPKKDLFPPPREDSVGTFLATPMPPDEIDELAGAAIASPQPAADTAVAEEEPAEEAPAEEAVETEESDRPTAESLGRIAAPEAPITRDLAEVEPKVAEEPEERVADERAEETITPEVPNDAVVGLEPAELRPPELENPSKESLSAVDATVDDTAIADAETPAPRVAVEPQDGGPEGTLGQVEAPAEEFEEGEEPPRVAVTEPEAPLDPVAPPQRAETAPPEATVAEPRLEPAEERPPKAASKPAPEEEPPEEEPAEEPAEEPERIAEAPAETPTRAKSWARENLPLISDLSPESYYLQVGAFSDPQSAKSAVDNLRGTYPVAVLSADSGDRSLYRLFVGPLNEDERGSVLYWIRGKGYADAFIRKGGV
ncbi:MAG: hypothetical protein GVY29_05970 [Spirochaetes bacterium]|jgi:hypothetical protein|nr:hypothetical protein [Spirochaetota bacterium]